MLIELIGEIAHLQTMYSSDNTDAMRRRGDLIRHSLPEALGRYRDRFRSKLGRYGSSIDIEGRDGIGRKTQAPWVRIFSRDLSPSATTGFYMVIHFAVDGSRCFVTVGCASTRWDNEKGDLIKSSDLDLQEKVEWARATVRRARKDTDGFTDTIDIGSSLALPRSFERATAFCQTHEIIGLTDRTLLASIDGALNILGAIYEAYAKLEDLESSEIATIEIEGVVNPAKKHGASRQGYGLDAEERKAVELRAMEIVREHLEAAGYDVKDESSGQSYDFLATRDGVQTKVEVKGTTSPVADAILMTANEVRLHLDKRERTALAIVSGIAFVERGQSPRCSGGVLEYREPSTISGWAIEPTAFMVRRTG